MDRQNGKTLHRIHILELLLRSSLVVMPPAQYVQYFEHLI